MIRPVWFIAPAITAAAALLGIYHVSQEAEGSSYASLAEAWPRLPEPVQAGIREAMVDNRLTRWEWLDLQRQVLESGSHMTWDLADAAPERLLEARAQLHERVGR